MLYRTVQFLAAALEQKKLGGRTENCSYCTANVNITEANNNVKFTFQDLNKAVMSHFRLSPQVRL